MKLLSKVVEDEEEEMGGKKPGTLLPVCCALGGLPLRVIIFMKDILEVRDRKNKFPVAVFGASPIGFRNLQRLRKF